MKNLRKKLIIIFLIMSSIGYAREISENKGFLSSLFGTAVCEPCYSWGISHNKVYCTTKCICPTCNDCTCSSDINKVKGKITEKKEKIINKINEIEKLIKKIEKEKEHYKIEEENRRSEIKMKYLEKRLGLKKMYMCVSLKMKNLLAKMFALNTKVKLNLLLVLGDKNEKIFKELKYYPFK